MGGLLTILAIFLSAAFAADRRYPSCENINRSTGHQVRLGPGAAARHYQLDVDLVMGEGDFGSVLPGTVPRLGIPGVGSGHFRPGMPVAVKLPFVDREGSVVALEHEAKLYERIEKEDPNGRFVRAAYDKAYGVLVMEQVNYIEGVPYPFTLASWLKENKGKEMTAERQKIVAQLDEAKAILKSAGIVHGDLRPENILVTSTGDLKIIDLGNAAEVGRYAPHMGQRRGGSPPYISPEQSDNFPAAFSDDGYSIGVIRRKVLGLRMLGA